MWFKSSPYDLQPSTQIFLKLIIRSLLKLFISNQMKFRRVIIEGMNDNQMKLRKGIIDGMDDETYWWEYYVCSKILFDQQFKTLFKSIRKLNIEGVEEQEVEEMINAWKDFSTLKTLKVQINKHLSTIVSNTPFLRKIYINKGDIHFLLPLLASPIPSRTLTSITLHNVKFDKSDQWELLSSLYNLEKLKLIVCWIHPDVDSDARQDMISKTLLLQWGVSQHALVVSENFEDSRVRVFHESLERVEGVRAKRNLYQNYMKLVKKAQREQELKKHRAQENTSAKTIHLPEEENLVNSAGAGGSSASYWISEAFANSSTSIKTTVYEQLSQVGGRALIFNYTRDNTQVLVELGASIFIDANYHMTNSAIKFGLEFINYGEELKNPKAGIWDGDQFVFEQSSSSYWDISKLIWKYGWAPIKVQRLVSATISKFLKTYEFKEPFKSVDSEAERLHLDLERKFTAQYYFSELKNINQLYLQHMVEPMSRVNYGQNLGEIHAMGAFISLAPTGAKSIKGGNYRLFEKFIEHSGATLNLNTKVVKVTKLRTTNDGEESVKYMVQTINGTTQVFDAIIMAAPIRFSGIEFENVYLEMKDIPYVTLHVTFVTGRLNPAYFNRTKVEDFPNQILTTNSGKTEFLSLSVKIVLENDLGLLEKYGNLIQD
ncbi:3443_t:CDS:2 [Racocetra fulgida]|uniref:3443_t:CDS:1 n=1 Tax=Racocetra fulgida TaxID=60492 RepID=A0A9N9F4R9_9GLOM|nr:3443_t:CDS:2 [Racocetra fulgida]